MKRLGTDEALLIRTLAHIPAVEIPCLNSTYAQFHSKYSKAANSLEMEIESETSGSFQKCLLSIVRGPLINDAVSLREALEGLGTREDRLNDVLIGRSNADIHAIKQAYYTRYKKSLETDIRKDMSLKTERLFMMILAGTRQEDSAPIHPTSVDADVQKLYDATEGRVGTEELTVCSILSNRSDGQIRAIAHGYNKTWGKSLEKVIEKEFSGHMEKALLQMVQCGCDRAKRDATSLYLSMKGMGTKDERLIALVTSLHWDRQHMAQVKGAYQHHVSKKGLVDRIKSETRGDYERCLVAMLED